jgi:hypothetical protein
MRRVLVTDWSHAFTHTLSLEQVALEGRARLTSDGEVIGLCAEHLRNNPSLKLKVSSFDEMQQIAEKVKEGSVHLAKECLVGMFQRLSGRAIPRDQMGRKQFGRDPAIESTVAKGLVLPCIFLGTCKTGTATDFQVSLWWAGRSRRWEPHSVYECCAGGAGHHAAAVGKGSRVRAGDIQGHQDTWAAAQRWH